MFKKKYSFFLPLTTLFMVLFSENNEHPQPPQNFYTIDNSQKIIIKKKETEVCCHDQHDEALVDCFFSLVIADQKEIFKQFAPSKRREFLRKLDNEHYKKFLKAYNEHDWKNLYNSLSDEEKKVWPKTVKEQTIALYVIKKESEIREALQKSTNIVIAYCIIVIFSIPPQVEIEKSGFKKYMEKTFEL